MRPRIIIPIIVVAIVAIVVAAVIHFREQHAPFQESKPTISQGPEQTPEAAEPAAALAGTRREPDLSAPTAPVEPGSSSPVIREITNPAGDIWARQKAARTLSLNLADSDEKKLMTFLRTKQPEDDAQAGHVLKSDLMDALVAQESIFPDLAGSLSAIYRDTAQHEVIRDYAIQHLSMLSERLEEPAGLDAVTVQSQKKLIQEVLWEASGTLNTSIAGTAMLGLARMAESDDTVDANKLGAAALQAATDPATQEATRIAALQLCGRLQLKSSLPLLASLAETGGSPMVRISAIGALGYVGGRTELRLLEKLDGLGDSRLRVAVAGAMKRITENTANL
jgi:hypothetical protein